MGKKMQIGLVNIDNGGEDWEVLGKTTRVRFERVSRHLQWRDLFPEWIDEDEEWQVPECPKIPMPSFDKYQEFDVVVTKVPCGNGGEREGIRDVFRLQVNLVVANLLVKSGLKVGNIRPVYAVFIGGCGPMWEIFRCYDLLSHVEDLWIYKPDLQRLKQKILMPVRTCQLSVPLIKHGGKDLYDFSKLENPIDHPREAYVTVLHSSEGYVCGAIALAQSIIRTNSTKDLVLLADESISSKSRQVLEIAGWKIIKNITRIESPFASKDAYNKWNYSKLRIWQLIEYDKVIFIDSDLIMLKNMDNFFVHPQLSAAANGRLHFNSGIMMVEPSNCVFEMLMKKRHTLVSYNGGDQGFINQAFTWWHRWPAKLNYLKISENANRSQSEQLPKSLYGLHYLGFKPWMCYRDYDCNWDLTDQRKFANDIAHKRWWEVYDAMPKKLQSFCALSEGRDSRLKQLREMAKNVSFGDGHWKIKIKDPRQHFSS